MIKTIKFKGDSYPHFQAEGNASQFAIPFAKHACSGTGFDVGYMKPEWKYPGSIGVDISYHGGMWHAMNLPEYYYELDGEKIPIDKKTNWEDVAEKFKSNGDDINILPIGKPDYIFSSHCLEHLPNYVQTLDYWMDTLASKGTLFLYLPDRSQKYWLPWNNRKHIHSFYPEIIRQYFESRTDVDNIFISGVDLNNSFMVMIEKI